MIKTVYDNMVDIVADDGKELVCVVDGVQLRAKHVSRPLNAPEWVEVDEIPPEVLASAPQAGNEYEAALNAIEEALNRE